MAINFEEYQKFGKDQLEAVQAAAGEVSKGLQAIAAESTDYSKRSLESGSAFVEKLLGVKKLDEAIALQQEFAKTSYEGYVARSPSSANCTPTSPRLRSSPSKARSPRPSRPLSDFIIVLRDALGRA